MRDEAKETFGRASKQTVIKQPTPRASGIFSVDFCNWLYVELPWKTTQKTPTKHGCWEELQGGGHSSEYNPPLDGS